jgi:hypothetical protein
LQKLSKLTIFVFQSQIFLLEFFHYSLKGLLDATYLPAVFLAQHHAVGCHTKLFTLAN